MMTSPEEQRLVLRAQEGCVHSFDELLRRHDKALFRHLRRMLGTDDDAYDALQLTFMVIVKGIGRLRRRESFRAWCYGVATRVGLKLIGRRPRDGQGPEDPDETWSEVVLDPSPSPEALALSDERRDMLLDGVLALAPRLRSVLLLHFYEGLSLDDVARALELRPGTVRSRLAAGLGKLRNTKEVRDHDPRTRAR